MVRLLKAIKGHQAEKSGHCPCVPKPLCDIASYTYALAQLHEVEGVRESWENCSRNMFGTSYII